MQDYEQNKKNALAFVKTAFDQGKPELAVEMYLGDTYTQHAPNVANGKEGFIEFAHKIIADKDFGTVHHRRVFADGDFVIFHAELMRPDGEGGTKSVLAIADFFRFDDDGKIVEHWDVLQWVPEESLNDNPLV